MKKFSIRSIGEIGQSNERVINTLTKTLLNADNLSIKMETILALNKIGNDSQPVIKALKKAFKSNEDHYIQLEILRTMGDIGTVEGVELARSYLKNGNETTDDKIEVLYVLSRIGKTECIHPILKIATEPPLKTYAFTVLSDFDPDIIVPFLKDLRRSESDKNVLEIINKVLYRFEDDIE